MQNVCIRNFSSALQGALIRSRRIWIRLLTIVLVFISYAGAIACSGDLALSSESVLFWDFFALLACCRLATYSYFQLNQGYWRYVSAREAGHVVMSHLLSSLMFLSLVAISASIAPRAGIPFGRSFIFLEFSFSVLLALGARLMVRLCCERYLLRTHGNPAAPAEVMIVGAGATGHLVAKTLTAGRSTCCKVAAVLDDDPAYEGMLVHGAPVVGPLSELGLHLERHPRICKVLLAIPNLPEAKRRSLERICEEFHVPLQGKQHEEHLPLEQPNDAHSAIPVDRLLNRTPQCNDTDEVSAAVSGRAVLVTGAGGSIGSELVRQLVRLRPAKLVLVDKSEYNLYAIGQELCDKGLDRNVDISYYLTDIVNHARLLKLFDDHRPEFVFHAAAYKHVPLLENNGYEAFLNNITGTFSLLRASKHGRAQRFVFVSTDKAVEPHSIMGCTKRICELMVQEVNQAAAACALPRPDHRLETAVVRFGNVIGSAGSVVPLFRKQILTGGPLTVTDERVERYFMSIPEAASLILTAGTLGRQGEIFMLDMGRPIKITEVAKKMRALYGRRDVSIEFVGLRPGEKLTEELYYSNEETRTETRFERIYAVRSPKSEAAASVFNWVQEVAPSLNHLTDQQITQMLRSFVSSVHMRKAREWGLDPARTAPSGDGARSKSGFEAGGYRV